MLSDGLGPQFAYRTTSFLYGCPTFTRNTRSGVGDEYRKQVLRVRRFLGIGRNRSAFFFARLVERDRSISSPDWSKRDGRDHARWLAYAKTTLTLRTPGAVCAFRESPTAVVAVGVCGPKIRHPTRPETAAHNHTVRKLAFETVENLLDKQRVYVYTYIRVDVSFEGTCRIKSERPLRWQGPGVPVRDWLTRGRVIITHVRGGLKKTCHLCVNTDLCPRENDAYYGDFLDRTACSFARLSAASSRRNPTHCPPAPERYVSTRW